jgi:capsular exopolysaccharide synthesis family protein
MKVVEPAIASEDPVFPKKKKMLLLGIIGGFFLGYGIAFMLMFFKETPYSVEAIKNLLPYGILGTVPRIKKELVLFRSSDNPAAAEQVRHIYTNIEFKGIYHEQHLNLLLTSAKSGEGKRVICANLAYPFAETGRRTVLVNLDLRRTAFNDLFTLQSTKGVTDFLGGTAQLPDIVSRHPGCEFDIIDAGKTVEAPARLFLRGKIDEFFTQLAASYDVCLFYSAPILSASETLDLSRYMNGIVLVADMTVSNVKSLTAMKELLENKGLPVLGTIINRTSTRV